MLVDPPTPAGRPAVVRDVAGPPCGCEEETIYIFRVSGRLVTRRCPNHPPCEYKPGDSRGGLGERDEAPGAIISNNSYKSKSRRNSSVEPDP